MKITIVPGILLLLVSLMSLGCASKATFQTVVGERDQAKQQLTTATQERDSLQTKLLAAESSLAGTQKQRDELVNRLAEREVTLASVTKARDDLQTKLTERGSALASVSKTRDDLQTKLATTEVILTAANRSLSALQTDLSKAKSDLANTGVAFDTLRKNTQQAQKYWDITDGLLLVLGAVVFGSEKQYLGKYSGSLIQGLALAGDLPLTAAWDKYVAVADEGGDKPLADFIALLRQRLSANKPYR